MSTIHLDLAADHYRAASDLLARAHEAGDDHADQAQTIGLAEYHAAQAADLLAPLKRSRA